MELLTIKLKKLFSENISRIFGADYIEKIDIQNSTKKEFGDFQTNFAMMSSKLIGKNPREIANTIIENFEKNDIIEKLEVAGPGFINIFLKNSFLNEEIKKLENEKYDFSFLNIDKTVIIDYSSPNIAKRMHIGHLRSTIIGDSIKRILNFLGFKTLADNHIGDWGTQFGKLIVAYKNWLDKKAYEEDPIGELERIYVLFSDKAKKDPALEDEAREELKKLQLGNEDNQKLWKEFIDISLKEYNKVYERLDVNFDYYYGESFYNDMMPSVLEELKKKNIAREDQGALVVFFEDDKLPPAIVQKKDGSFLYTTSDLATMKFRKNELKVDEAVYLTDDRQQNHFKQVFEIGKMLGEPYDYKKTHIVFGIMRFGDQIFSSRSGNTIRLVDLLDEAKKQVKKVIDEKNPNIPEEEKEKIAETIGSGAIKYFDLSQNRTSDITFTWEKVLNFEGNTGPYLQYTYVRIMSIFRKLEEENINVENMDIVLDEMDGIERELASELLKFPQAVVKSYENFRPNIIADYLFDTAKLFNSFYNSSSILKEEDKQVMDARILLAKKTAFVLKEGLELLGIKTVNRM
ncbi:arginine--tRNA ligase [Leptotrichia buccalis]|uniref:Arginine--tRNA ligase n=1 Tax=Leptotrichia buccalis (strain ATCC 14201 / DSM 1135 / JCM 12969 / NCTC 10249 / C-1013-b) TaxID=523794 RepID=C7NCJ3_LEPBD|nr:arginine--tRNA ligase [Leptotrichia buccalis]ACV39839.1 arginyl-tRNA synthetase [Leptotrichia buccalis C-1013-b]